MDLIKKIFSTVKLTIEYWETLFEFFVELMAIWRGEDENLSQMRDEILAAEDISLAGEKRDDLKVDF